MRRLRIVIVGLLYMVVAAVHAEDRDLSIEPFKASITAAKEVANKESMKLAGYVEGNNPQTGEPGKPVEFVTLEGGRFMMGTNTGDQDASLIHEVIIKTFDISDTLVTVEQYAECVRKGKCEPPTAGVDCNWGKSGRQRHPINCVSWKDANAFATFKGAGVRLPSEGEYEYAATSKGKNQPYPWGMAEATCDKAVMRADERFDCGNDGTMPVCSKPKGNTEQGLCDMAGNVWQWMQDAWHDSYAGAPTDGSAWESGSSPRVLRGGSFLERGGLSLRADKRAVALEERRAGHIGFRLARSRR